jgi:hypothetical protein
MGSQPLGAEAILSQHPHDRPKRPKRSPAPFFHAESDRVRRELWEAYRLFVAAFRQQQKSSEQGSCGIPARELPAGLPFVGG